MYTIKHIRVEFHVVAIVYIQIDISLEHRVIYKKRYSFKAISSCFNHSCFLSSTDTEWCMTLERTFGMVFTTEYTYCDTMFSKQTFTTFTYSGVWNCCQLLKIQMQIKITGFHYLLFRQLSILLFRNVVHCSQFNTVCHQMRNPMKF